MKTLPLLVALSVVCSWGCQRNRTPAVEYGTVKGLVTLDGEPLTTGIIRFHEPDSGNIASSPLSESAGTYHLTFGGGEKIPAGNYVVTVSPVIHDTSDISARTAIPAATAKRFRVTSADELIPKKYQQGTTSKLSAVVTKGENSFNFELKSK